MKNSGKRILAEVTLWTLANALSLLVAGGLTYLTVRHFLDWSPSSTSVAVSAALLLSLTWGSWASLVWTKTKALRRIQEVLTLVPGLLLVLIGGLGIYSGIGGRLFWGLWMLSGAGVIGAPLVLLKLNHNKIGTRKYSIPLGLIAYPLLTTILSLLIWSLWYVNIRDLENWRALLQMATLVTTITGVALTTTIIPSIISTSLRRVSIFLEQKN